MSKKTADLADSYLARGIATCINPEDVQDGYTPPGCMSDLMHGGINDSGSWQQSGPDPYFADFEGTGDQDETMTGRGRSHPATEVTYARYEDTPAGARQLGPSRGGRPEPGNFRHDGAGEYPASDWNEPYRAAPGVSERSPERTSFTGNKRTPMDREGHAENGGSAVKKWRR